MLTKSQLPQQRQNREVSTLKTVLDRFLTYVAIDTQSTYNPKTFPSTQKQFDLAKLLAKELEDLGVVDVSIADNANVYGLYQPM